MSVLLVWCYIAKKKKSLVGIKMSVVGLVLLYSQKEKKFSRYQNECCWSGVIAKRKKFSRYQITRYPPSPRSSQ